MFFGQLWTETSEQKLNGEISGMYFYTIQCACKSKFPASPITVHLMINKKARCLAREVGVK